MRDAPLHIRERRMSAKLAKSEEEAILQGLIKRGQIESMPWASDDIDIDIGEDADSDVLPEEGDEDAARGAKVRPRHFPAACPASVTQVAASGSCSAWECGSRRSPPAPP